MNHIVLHGVIAKDGVLKNNRLYSTIAVTRWWKDKEGNRQEKTNFFDFQINGEKFSSFYEPRIKKGKELMIRGELTNWENKDPEKNTTYTNYAVVVEKVEMCRELPSTEPKGYTVS